MKEIDLNLCRWIVYLKNGNVIVENHQHGRTWKKVYKDNYGAINAICFQFLPSGEKHFIHESPTGEYWTFEEFDVQFGGGSKHVSRSICSKQSADLEETYWDVMTVYPGNIVERRTMTGKEIGYNTLYFVNREEREFQINNFGV